MVKLHLAFSLVSHCYYLHIHTHTQLTNALSVLSTSLSHVVGIGDSLETAKALQSRVIEANQKLKVQSPTSPVLV